MIHGNIGVESHWQETHRSSQDCLLRTRVESIHCLRGRQTKANCIQLISRPTLHHNATMSLLKNLTADLDEEDEDGQIVIKSVRNISKVVARVWFYPLSYCSLMDLSP